MRQEYKFRDNSRGFSLIELMIVIAIIGILVGVGVPAWQASIVRANETFAIGSLKTIYDDERNYYIGHKAYGTFDQLIQDGALDKRFAGDAPVVEGYIYTIKVTPKSNNQPALFGVNADPQVGSGLTKTGNRHFYIGSDVNSIHVSDTQQASVEDPPL